MSDSTASTLGSSKLPESEARLREILATNPHLLLHALAKQPKEEHPDLDGCYEHHHPLPPPGPSERS